jgi:polysaccharide export outer membrane protein
MGARLRTVSRTKATLGCLTLYGLNSVSVTFTVRRAVYTLNKLGTSRAGPSQISLEGLENTNMMQRSFVGLIIAASLISGLGASVTRSAPQNNDAALSGQASSANTVATDPDYKIGPQDMLRVDVWKEPDISRTVPVRPDGKITLPLVNDVQASGLTPTQLAAKIAEGLKKYITSPQVTVGVTEINSRRIFVSGEVAHPGAFPLFPNMTVLQALSSAGGFTQFAREKKIYILRMENGRQVKHPFNYKDAISGKNVEQNILLEGGDIIVVP